VAVVDASVVVAALHADEAGHAASLAWWEAALRAGDGLFAPAIVLAEAAAGVARFLDAPNLAGGYVGRWLAASRVTIWPVWASLATRAAEIVGTERVRGCDAVYLALAEALGQPLVTLDTEQLERGTTVVPTMRPGEVAPAPDARGG